MTAGERGLPTDAECDAIADNLPAPFGGYRQYDRALIRAGANWQAGVAQAAAHPAGPREKLLEEALVHTAFGLHGTPQHMLCAGVALLDNDQVRVTLPDGRQVQTARYPPAMRAAAPQGLPTAPSPVARHCNCHFAAFGRHALWCNTQNSAPDDVGLGDAT